MPGKPLKRPFRGEREYEESGEVMKEPHRGPFAVKVVDCRYHDDPRYVRDDRYRDR